MRACLPGTAALGRFFHILHSSFCIHEASRGALAGDNFNAEDKAMQSHAKPPQGHLKAM
jgi:hypothetical protein